MRGHVLLPYYVDAMQDASRGLSADQAQHGITSGLRALGMQRTYLYGIFTSHSDRSSFIDITRSTPTHLLSHQLLNTFRSIFQKTRNISHYFPLTIVGMDIASIRRCRSVHEQTAKCQSTSAGCSVLEVLLSPFNVLIVGLNTPLPPHQ